MPNGQVVRSPLRVRDRTHRTLDQRLALRIPASATAYTRLVDRLAPSSRLRQRLMLRFMRAGVEAVNRRDVDVLLLGRHADYELHPARNMVEAGFAEPCYRGPAGYREWVATWFDVWGEGVRIEPVEFIDLGDRMVLLAEIRSHGTASGVPLAWKHASVSRLRAGRVYRDDLFVDYAEALEAVGLPGG